VRDDRKFLELARKRFRDTVEAERDLRREAEIDLQYVAGQDQWNPGIKQEREDSGRPALTFSKLHTFVQSVQNEARQNKPQPKTNPIGGGATTDVANVLNGILRHIQYRSQADVASDTALEYACGGSFGYLRFTTEYADPKSFDQEIRISAVEDPFTVYGVLLPVCRGKEPRFAFVVDRIPKEEYREKYGNPEDAQNFESSEWRDCEDWIDEKTVRIAEYWTCENQTRTLRHIQGADAAGTPTAIPIYADDPGYSEQLPFIADDDGTPKEREVEMCVVKSCLIDGTRVLPGTETVWVGDSIPIIPVLGRQMIVDGKVNLFSLVRHVREPQQLINIYKSAIAEKIGLGNRVPYIGVKGQFKDPRWENANLVNYAYLEYEPISIAGTLAPPPQRQQMEEQIQALSVAAAQEIDDLKAGMGIFDASLGAQGNETSGVAIGTRQRQSNITNFHFVDNLCRSEWELCKKILKVIPKIYDRPGRQVRIVGEDQQHSVVVVNQTYADPETGKQKHYPLDVGEYDVVVTVGPSYTTARQEGAETLGEFFKAAPQTIPLLGDLWVGSLDFPWAREGARRLKLAAPQQIVNDDSQDGPAPIPPAIQQQITQLQQDAQQAHAFAQSLFQKLETKQPELDVKLKMQQADLDFKREQLAATISMQQAQMGLTAAITQLTQELNVIKAERATANANAQAHIDRAHQVGMQAMTQAHQAGMAQQAQAADANAQASDQAHQAGMQQSAQDAAAQQDAMPQAA
jgi:O6-methylguanine-DNA--protein-cysteine methyltransferase